MPDDPTKKQEKHVTDLVGPDDRWVSVTDASRIGRRQEHTIRTWIAQGLLPVNPERVGINKKTRQVRLSDLAKLTPIIDPDAGIATDLGTLDLPSIPKQQLQLLAQMTALQQEVTGQLASLGEQLHELAGKHEHFAEETRQTWLVTQQQYQALAHRDEEQQQLIQRVRDSLTESLQALDRSLHQELAGQLEHYQRLTEQVTSYSQELQQTRQDLSALVIETEKTLRQALSDQVGQSEAALRQALETMQQLSAKAMEQVRKDVAGLDERLGQLATQLTEVQSTWQEQAIAAEQEVRQLRRDLDAQGRLQQTLQQQLAAERKAREELTRQVNKLFQQG